MIKWLLILIFSFLAINICHGQDDDLVFKHLTEENGLNNNFINCIYKSTNGRMWIASYNGFNGYDGANFTSHKMRKGPNSLPNEVVQDICEDKNGLVWGATNNGVFSYNPKSDKYYCYKLKSANSSLNFFNILCDKNGTIWATGTWSLFRYDSSKDSFAEQLILKNPFDTSKLCFVTKNGLLEEAPGNRLWITTSFGLWYYDYKNNKAGNAGSEINNPLFAVRNTAALGYAQPGGFWFFDNNTKSIIKFDPVQKKETYKIPIAKNLPDAQGATLFEDKNKRLWFSSWNFHTLIIDLAKNDSIRPLFHRPDDNRSIAGNFIWSAYHDENNTLWLGTMAGISKCNTQNEIYKEYRIFNIIKELRDKSIRIAEQDPIDNSYWILSSDTVLYHYDKANPYQYKKIPVVDAEKNSKGKLPENISTIKFLDNMILLCSNSGIWQLVRNDIRLLPFNQLPAAYAAFEPIEIVKDGDDTYYFNDGRKVLYWDRLKSITQLFSFTKSNSEIRLDNMCITGDHKLWLLTNEKKLATIKKGILYEIDLKRDFDKETGHFWSLKPDAKNNLWILYRGTGIYYFNTTTQEVKLWDMTDGLPANRMRQIAFDKPGNLWSIFYDKISVLDPNTKQFYNFKVSYKTSDIDYENHLTLANNGNILGSISNELVEFFPERLLAKPKLSKPVISQLNVKSKTYYELGDDVTQLDADENTIRVSFGSFIDKTIFPYELEYKLNGKNDAWISAGENTEIIFTNLASGNYKLQVRAKGNNDAWISEAATIQFNIKTPFLQTTWFKLSLLLLVAIALYLLYRYRVRQKDKLVLLESKTQMLEKEKALVMYENLKQQLNPHFLFNSLTSLRSLIRLDQHMAGDFLEKMSKVYRYILKNRDNEVVPISEEIIFVQMYIDLQKTRFGDGLQVHMNIAEECLHRKIAPVTLQNLVENAIKHNTANQESPLVIQLFVEDDYLVVQNNLQKKNFVETSNRQGLANMESLYRFLSNRPMLIIEDNIHFTVKIPLI